MLKLLICYGLIHIIAASPQSKHYGTTPKDVEVFAPLYPGFKVPDPPLPQSPGKRKPKPTTARPTYPSPEPNPPTFYPKKPPSSTKKPLVTTKDPPIYPSTSKNPINFPTAIYPSFGSNIPHSTTSQPPRTSVTRVNTWPSTRWPVTSSKPQGFPSPTPGSTWQPKYPNSAGTGSKGTPSWIYPPRPSWPKPHHLVVTEAVQVHVEDDGPLTGHLSEYQAYNEDDGSFKLGFELRNGISAKVHGYMKNGKLVLEGSYSIFTQDGKPVNIVYKADDNNYEDDEPTIFHLNIPPFDPSNLDDDKNDHVDLVPTDVPYYSKSSKILSVVESGNDDGQ